MRKLKKFTVGTSIILSENQMVSVLGGDTDPNVCHSKTTDSMCFGKCQQYFGGSIGNCNWDFNTHSCQCVVKQ